MKNSIDFKEYIKKYFHFDLVAGLTVAMIAIPQTMAYAIIVGVDPIYGLFSATVPAIIGSFFGSSSFLITGASNASALATAGIIAVFSQSPDFLQYVFALSIASGLIKLILGLLKQGNITRFISNSVQTGFLTGVGALIILNQLPNFLGISKPSQNGTIETLIHMFNKAPLINWVVAALGVFVVLLMAVFRKINRRIPSALIVISLSAIGVSILNLEEKGVKIIGDIASTSNFGLVFSFPKIPVSDLTTILFGGITLSLFTLIETMSVAKSYSIKTNQSFNASREFTAQGLASIFGGFFSSIPTSGSPSRTSINFESGAKTKFAGVFSGLIVLAVGTLFGNLITYIPMVSLAGVVIFSAFNLIDIERIKDLWKTQIESKMIFLLTLIATLFLDIQYAIYFGIALSIIVYLSKSSHLKISLIDFEEGETVEYDFSEIGSFHKPYVILNLEGSLYFAAIEEFEASVMEVIKRKIPNIILRFRRTDHIGSSGISALKRLRKEAGLNGINMYYCGLSNQLFKLFQDSGIAGEESENFLYPRHRTVYSSAKTIVNQIMKKSSSKE